MDTIFALATAAGRAGVAIIRVSGPDVAAAMAVFEVTVPVNGRRLVRMMGPDGLIDEALALHFSAGRSFTGQEVVEFQCHGGPAVVAAILRVLSDVPGCRAAEAGEFTRRAFECGRLSLDQVEALSDLIDAETERQRGISVRLFGGALQGLAEQWRSRLLRVSGLVMAGIDFADEEIPESVVAEAGAVLAALAVELEDALARSDGVERIRAGFEVALVGAPNSGKSTLLNRIAGRDVAITSEIAGTTRDIVEVRLDLGGLAVTMLDTAGVRDALDPVEAIGVERTVARAEAADLRVFLGDTLGIEVAVRPGDLVLSAKDDEGTKGGVSGLTGAGVDVMLTRITDELSCRVPDDPVLGRQRQIDHVRGALAAVREAEAMIGVDVALADDAVAEARRALEMIVGRIGVEDVLGEVFESFCVGK